jgi:leucyl aminopeptidase
MKIDFTASAAPRAGAIVALAADGKALSPTAQRLDRDSGGAVKRAINESKFKGGKDQTLTIMAPRGVRASRIVLVGIGKPDAFDANAAFGTGSTVYAALGNTGETQALVSVEAFPNMKLDPAEAAAQIAYGAQLRSYRFDKYRTKEKPEDKPTLNALTVAVRNDRAARAAYAPLGKVAEAIFFTRDLVAEPANVITRSPSPTRRARSPSSASRSRCWTVRRSRSSGWARSSASPRAAPTSRASSPCAGRETAAPRTSARSRSSARASRSIPAASRSSPPPTWRT